LPVDGDHIYQRGTEGDNLAILGLSSSGDHVITSAIEHSAIKQSCAWLQTKGVDITSVPVDHNGQVDPDDVVVHCDRDSRASP